MDTRHWSSRASRPGFTWVELLAVVTILGTLAALGLSRVWGTSAAGKARACDVYQGDIEVQAQLWYRNHGSWPASNLSDLGSDPNYFPQGLPTCPVDGSGYTLDPFTHEVAGHAH